MTEQDADSEQVDSEPDERPENVDESLEEIAEEPDDADADLSAILNGETVADDGTTSDAGRTDPDEVSVDGDIVETVESASAENIARAIATLRAEVESLDEQLAEERERADDLESRLKRKQADFQNYKKRQKKRMKEEKQRATEDLVGRLLDVRDNLQRALDQDENVDIRGGVETTLEQFDEQLERENVTAIEPQAGDGVDPQRHEVLATVESDQPADAIAGLHRPGYEMAGKVIRAAQVTVSDGSNHDEDETTDSPSDSGNNDESTGPVEN